MQRQNATIGDKIVDTLTMSAPSEAFVLCYILFTQSNVPLPPPNTVVA